MPWCGRWMEIRKKGVLVKERRVCAGVMVVVVMMIGEGIRVAQESDGCCYNDTPIEHNDNRWNMSSHLKRPISGTT